MLNKIKNKTLYLFSLLAVSLSSVRADVVSEVGNGGNIASSALGVGITNMIKDITGIIRNIILIASVGYFLWCIFKIMTGDEQDNVKYKKNIVKALICVVIALMAVTIVNLVAGYFGK